MIVNGGFEPPLVICQRSRLLSCIIITFVKIPTKNRRGIFDAGIMILGVIIVIIAIISATLAWSDILQVAYVSLITDMPRFDYQVHGGSESGNKNFEIYSILRTISFFLIVFTLMFAGMSIMFEKINIMPPETGFKIISKSIYFVFFFFFFPPLWDISSTAVEQLSIWILNPQDAENSSKNIEILLKKLGSIECVDPNDPDGDCHFTLDTLVSGMTDPFGALKNIFQTAFLGVFKAIAFLSFMFVSFLVGTIRQVLTAIIIIGLPMLMILSLLPFFKRIVSRFIDAMLGLLIAPIFSSLVIVAGVAYLGTINGSDPIIEWFAALAIMALASLVPAMVVPIMGPLVGMVQGVVGPALSTGGMVTSMAGFSAARGMTSAMSGVIQNVRDDGVSDVRSAITGSGVTSIIKNMSDEMFQNKPTNHTESQGGGNDEVGKIPRAILDSLGINQDAPDTSRASLNSGKTIGNENADKGKIADAVNALPPPKALFDALDINPPNNAIYDGLSAEPGRNDVKPYESFFDRFFSKFSRIKDRL